MESMWKKMIHSREKKSRAQQNAEVAAAEADDADVDNQPDEMEAPSLLVAKRQSQLIRMIASIDDTINKLRTKRKAPDEKVVNFMDESRLQLKEEYSTPQLTLE